MSQNHSQIALRLLDKHDVKSLLEFELDNRDWFEQFIDSRGDEFYTRRGLEEHIRHCLSQYEQNLMYPTLIIDQHGKICGRANIHFIEHVTKRGAIGYRIGQNFCHQGMASQATRLLIEHAKNHLQLKQLAAFASVENLASQRVLEKNGFVKAGIKEEFTLVQDQVLDCFDYRLSLTSP
ncbi:MULTISPECIES: GNAT family N-acetyltransferase [Vibrio]|uniref:GNAT family N-acetyltransferase n=1 Tax=Vibrio cortegadensis TaxID=1328770 RepID=A0ABV4M4M3_9VIBR|nr:GNAT family N-acetyltransferase [Vibrio sp. 03-59-1]NOH82652.1 GNAT family N-acetyltransferase [Vibrio sp. 03-59-1]